MEYIVYVFGVCFFFLALALLFAYHRTKHYGLFLIGITYAASAGLAFALMHWWPLAAGFILAWVLRLLGLDPDAGSKEPDR